VQFTEKLVIKVKAIIMLDSSKQSEVPTFQSDIAGFPVIMYILHNSVTKPGTSQGLYFDTDADEYQK